MLAFWGGRGEAEKETRKKASPGTRVIAGGFVRSVVLAWELQGASNNDDEDNENATKQYF